jgi:hypothetical protein
MDTISRAYLDDLTGAELHAEKRKRVRKAKTDKLLLVEPALISPENYHNLPGAVERAAPHHLRNFGNAARTLSRRIVRFRIHGAPGPQETYRGHLRRL